MSCDFTEQVSLLIDGELAANEASRVERHVVTCFECQEARAAFLNFRREISDYQITLDPRAQERALADILANRTKTAEPRIVTIGWRERFAAAFTVPRFATAMATVLILVGVVSFIVFRSAPYQSPVVKLPENNQQPGVAPVKDRPAPAAIPVPEPPPQSDAGTMASNNEKPGTRDTVAAAPITKRTKRDTRVPSLSRPPNANSDPSFVLASANSANGRGVRSADAETLTAQHVEQSSLLLRTFRNAQVDESDELSHERKRARQLVYQNILLRREATRNGNIQVASLLDGLEPILIDIANLPARPTADEVKTIQQRMERKNLVPLLQVNSTQLARAFD